jgi:hypothetical protein
MVRSASSSASPVPHRERVVRTTASIRPYAIALPPKGRINMHSVKTHIPLGGAAVSCRLAPLEDRQDRLPQRVGIIGRHNGEARA